MKKINNAFSLIEVVIATSVISITVFWIYKLMWENNKIIANSSSYLQVNSLFPTLEECIENIWFSYFNSHWATEYNFNFWDPNLMDECKVFWTDEIIIDDINYSLTWTITNKVADKYIEWELSIASDNTKTMTWYYKQIKK